MTSLSHPMDTSLTIVGSEKLMIGTKSEVCKSSFIYSFQIELMHTH